MQSDLSRVLPSLRWSPRSETELGIRKCCLELGVGGQAIPFVVSLLKRCKMYRATCLLECCKALVDSCWLANNKSNWSPYWFKQFWIPLSNIYTFTTSFTSTSASSWRQCWGSSFQLLWTVGFCSLFDWTFVYIILLQKDCSLLKEWHKVFFVIL